MIAWIKTLLLRWLGVKKDLDELTDTISALSLAKPEVRYTTLKTFDKNNIEYAQALVRCFESPELAFYLHEMREKALRESVMARGEDRIFRLAYVDMVNIILSDMAQKKMQFSAVSNG